MDDKEINIKLAEVMGADEIGQPYWYSGGKVAATWKPAEGFKWPTGKDIDYKDPAIAMENLQWLLDNGYKVDKSVNDNYCVYFFGNAKCRKSLPKALALARIEASK